MTTIGSRRPMTLAQSRFKREYIAILKEALRKIDSILMRYASADGTIRNESAVKTQVEQVISDIYTGRDNHHAFADDQRTPIAPYSKLLVKWMAWTSFQAVLQQEKWLKGHTPDDVYTFLRSGKKRILSEIAARGLFSQNPLANIDPVRRWVHPLDYTDDRGYRLSDRIWRTDLETRRKIDELLSRGLRDGRSATQLSKALEAYLIPGREGIRTLRPYGTRFPAGGASFDAMRLGRTELAAAFNNAALAAGLMNPYVTMIEVARSANGDASCPICPEHATIGMAGERLRDPYPIDEADIPPFHPHDMCVVLQVVTENPQAVTDQLRQMLDDAQEQLDLNPSNAWDFVSMLLGEEMMALLFELLGAETLRF